ncbi:FecR domain-containing protein [Pedobacter sp. MC2016-14]|uniref:FecR family protein n=1 Tax=Pedobacter sp. MC2016-14 TaxID=2897327 RepID=UPI001E3843FF|nr:FecR domain-containing protein [Pedobacter sp. MC2016-14]MCD0488696.1 FecR domain-containing protein [Pedobacter sp. MC2016-14]
MDNGKKAEELVKKFNEGQETEQEKAIVNYWLHHLNEEEVSSLSEADLLGSQDEMWKSVEPAIPLKRRYKLFPSIAAAAVLIMTLSAGLYIYVNKTVSERRHLAKHSSSTIVPGGNKAILTLADGRKIILNDVSNGELAEQSGIKISKAADGQIIYSVTDAFAKGNKKALYNTIETPKGGQYQINLPDGSLVWLNAASRLRFPTRFIGSERNVELSGEGYFEIAHNKKMPFKVKTSRQEIEVLGTHFNLNSYADDDLVKTTLLEGSVRVTSLVQGDKAVVLEPGQQSVLGQKDFKISRVDVENALAWKNGYFRFDDEELESIMHKVSRWYNVDVIYKNEKLKREPFAGIITRATKISDLLKMLEQAGEVKFEIDNNKIVVMNKS